MKEESIEKQEQIIIEEKTPEKLEITESVDNEEIDTDEEYKYVEIEETKIEEEFNQAMFKNNLDVQKAKSNKKLLSIGIIIFDVIFVLNFLSNLLFSDKPLSGITIIISIFTFIISLIVLLHNSSKELPVDYKELNEQYTKEEIINHSYQMIEYNVRKKKKNISAGTIAVVVFVLGLIISGVCGLLIQDTTSETSDFATLFFWPVLMLENFLNIFIKGFEISLDVSVGILVLGLILGGEEYPELKHKNEYNN